MVDFGDVDVSDDGGIEHDANISITEEPKRRTGIFTRRQPEPLALEQRRADATPQDHPVYNYAVTGAQYAQLAHQLSRILGPMTRHEDVVVFPTFYQEWDAAPTYDRAQKRHFLELPVPGREDRWATMHAIGKILKSCGVNNLTLACEHTEMVQVPRGDPKRMAMAEGRGKAHTLLSLRSEMIEKYGKVEGAKHAINAAIAGALTTDLETGAPNTPAFARLMTVFMNHGAIGSFLVGGYVGGKKFLDDHKEAPPLEFAVKTPLLAGRALWGATTMFLKYERGEVEAWAFKKAKNAWNWLRGKPADERSGYTIAREFYAHVDFAVLTWIGFFGKTFDTVPGDTLYVPLRNNLPDSNTNERLHLCAKPDQEDKQKTGRHNLVNPDAQRYVPGMWQSIVAEVNGGLRINLHALGVELNQAAARKPGAGIPALDAVASDLSVFVQQEANQLAQANPIRLTSEETQRYQRDQLSVGRLVSKSSEIPPVFISQTRTIFVKAAQAQDLVITDARTIAHAMQQQWVNHNGKEDFRTLSDQSLAQKLFSTPRFEPATRDERNNVRIASSPQGLLVTISPTQNGTFVYVAVEGTLLKRPFRLVENARTLNAEQIRQIGLDAKAYPAVMELPTDQGIQYLAWKDGCLLHFSAGQERRVHWDTPVEINAFTSTPPGAVPRFNGADVQTLEQQSRIFPPSPAIRSSTAGGQLTTALEAMYPNDAFAPPLIQPASRR
ncbi:MAG: hypothetical protein J0L97_01875 [Alphaproteobacteria bacterium]|nr:hypothetical protein [Alphaproteobacteria bacterium]